MVCVKKARFSVHKDHRAKQHVEATWNEDTSDDQTSTEGPVYPVVYITTPEIRTPHYNQDTPLKATFLSQECVD
jgi:hypothetical protein